MAISAALAENDFETAYSYVVNRLTPPPPTSPPVLSTTSDSTPSALNNPTNPSTTDDISWRAALEAGRHRSAILHSSSAHSNSPSTSATNPQLRRLEQRMELLSQALLLAPSSSLTEVLAAWRRCEEELLALLATENAAEHEHNSQAELQGRGGVGGEMAIPGGFGAGIGLEPGFAVQPRRKEMGRGAVEEAPMGLFDVARGAAAALGRSAGGLGLAEKAQALRAQGIRSASGTPIHGGEQHGAGLEGEGAGGRVRKRDMVANAVAGGLVSGIGWVLGANPTAERPRSSGN